MGTLADGDALNLIHPPLLAPIHDTYFNRNGTPFQQARAKACKKPASPPGMNPQRLAAGSLLSMALTVFDTGRIQWATEGETATLKPLCSLRVAVSPAK